MNENTITAALIGPTESKSILEPGWSDLEPNHPGASHNSVASRACLETMGMTVQRRSVLQTFRRELRAESNPVHTQVSPQTGRGFR
jgi:hypothetical protein